MSERPSFGLRISGKRCILVGGVGVGIAVDMRS